MLKTETLFKGDESRLCQVGPSLAETYKIAFAGDPWYEASRCDNPGCQVSFSALTEGSGCESCKRPLVEAYSTDDLVQTWLRLLCNEDATFYVAYDSERQPLRATIVRPTNPLELSARKYQNVPQMQQWLVQNLPYESVWIEDTFANRNLQPSGNLRDRGRMLGDIAMRYGGLVIATRTLQPAIIRATVRDVGPTTDVFLGSEAAGTQVLSGARSVGTVPDRRTFIRVGDMV